MAVLTCFALKFINHAGLDNLNFLENDFVRKSSVRNNTEIGLRD